MRRFFCLLTFILLASMTASAAKRVTVQELTQILASLQTSQKSDQEVADRLKQLQLSEELTSIGRDALAQYLPGDHALEQMEILRGLSVFEPPAPSSIPSTPAPDANAQKALLDRASAWLASAFLQSPTFTTSKVTIRYQDDVQRVEGAPGLRIDLPNTYSKLAEAHTDRVAYSKGVGKLMDAPAKSNWGSNGQISEGGPMQPLPEMFEEALASGKLAFARWETVFDKPAAVFSFSVEKKRSRYAVSYCCFPLTDTTTVGVAAGNGLSPGSVQSVTVWRPFKKVVPYRGLIYIDPVSGAILRTVTFAELKPNEFVHTENVRIDYSAEMVGGKNCIVPQRSFTMNETVPDGDAGTQGYFVRHALFVSIYGNYRLGQ